MDCDTLDGSHGGNIREERQPVINRSGLSSDKVTAITGGLNGIGEACTRSFVAPCATMAIYQASHKERMPERKRKPGVSEEATGEGLVSTDVGETIESPFHHEALVVRTPIGEFLPADVHPDSFDWIDRQVPGPRLFRSCLTLTVPNALASLLR